MPPGALDLLAAQRLQRRALLGVRNGAEPMSLSIELLGCTGYREFDQLRSDRMTRNLFGHGDGQLKPTRPRAAWIDTEHSTTFLQRRLVRMSGHNNLESGCYRIHIQLC
jgi:hypothetical protein